MNCARCGKPKTWHLGLGGLGMCVPIEQDPGSNGGFIDPETEMGALLVEIERVLPKVEWQAKPEAVKEAEGELAPRCHVGTYGKWYFVVTSFSIEPQGFPPGSRGWDGAGRKGSVVIRLTRQLAERACKLAEGT